jgi:hypothetical protein
MMDPVDFTEVDGIPVTTVARTLLDLAGVLSPQQLEYAVDRAERLEVFDLRQIEDVLRRARGRKGTKALRAAIAHYQPVPTKTELEHLLRELVGAIPVPTPQYNVLVHGECITHEVDAYWSDHRLVVECDSYAWHHTRRDHKRDAAKRADLELAGYRVMTVNWDDVKVRRRETERRVLAALTGRGAATRASGSRA